MRKNSYLILICAFLFTTSNLKAQFFNYLSSKASAENLIYNDLGNLGTKVTTNFKGQPFNYSGDNSNVQNLGFTFNFAGTNFTQFTANAKGFIKLGNDTAAVDESNDILFSTHAKSTNVIYPFNTKLLANIAAEVRVYSFGTAGSKTCVIQFKGFKDSGCSDCENQPGNTPTPIQYDDVEFQIFLYEGTNNIDFVYGGFTGNLNAPGYIPVNCGLKTSSQANSVNATKSSQSAHTNVAFIDGAYTGNRFNNRNNLLPNHGFTIHWQPLQILNNNVQLLSSYIVGKVPKRYDHIMTVNVQNIGATALTNFPVTVTVTGANPFTLFKLIPSIASGAKATVSFPQFSWANVGENKFIITIPSDDDNANNQDTIIQNVTPLTIGYCPTNVIGGVIGNTTNSIDLATRFRNPNPSRPNKVLSVSAYLDTAGRSFRMFLYGISGDTPRVKLTNPLTNITSVAGKNTLNYPAGISITGDFFVVVTQTNVNTSVRLGFQREDPIREKTFYYRIPQGSTVSAVAKWEDFAPSNPFRLMVDVTMQDTFLPVKLMNFNGYRESGFNQLAWQTQGETNNLGFEIERSSNGKEFNKIGFVNGKGDERTLASYLYNDKNPMNGNNYYRLRQIDKDGTATYSDVVVIKNYDAKKLEVVSIYPNPSKGNTTLIYNTPSSGKVNINIINSLGKVINSQLVSTIAGENKIQLNTNTLSVGNYIINVSDASSEKSVFTQLIKQ